MGGHRGEVRLGLAMAGRGREACGGQPQRGAERWWGGRATGSRTVVRWYRYWYRQRVAKIDKTVAAMRNAPQNDSYNELRSVCVHFFGEPRQSGASHAAFKTPWPGDPRVNIQKAKDGKAKSYQVRQVLKAIDKVQEEQK